MCRIELRRRCAAGDARRLFFPVRGKKRYNRKPSRTMTPARSGIPGPASAPSRTGATGQRHHPRVKLIQIRLNVRASGGSRMRRRLSTQHSARSREQRKTLRVKSRGHVATAVIDIPPGGRRRGPRGIRVWRALIVQRNGGGGRIVVTEYRTPTRAEDHAGRPFRADGSADARRLGRISGSGMT